MIRQPLIVVLLWAGCGSALARDVEMPSNVSIKAIDRHNRVIDRIDFSFDSSTIVSYKAMKLCFAETLSNQDTSTVDIFKYEDEATQTVIATGTTDDIKYDVKAAIQDRHIRLVFSNLIRMSSYGHLPVGAWRGARPEQVYGLLKTAADRIQTCAQNL